MAKQNLGRVAMVSKGEYSSATTYERLDIVTYQGSSYVCKKDSTGNLPTNTEYFDLLAQKGTDYIITQQDYQEIADVVETDIQPTISAIETTANNAKTTANNANTIANTANSTANTAKSIAEGANQSLSYNNYQSMITEFNALADDIYNVGQNVMIVTLEVPDLWISAIQSTSISYTYTTDEAFINELATNGYVQVGYYRLSALETQKVDLTNYYTKSEANTELAKKVNNADVEEKDLLITYEDETTETVKLVVYK